MIKAYSLQTQILVELPPEPCRLERRDGVGEWLVLTESGFVPDGCGVKPKPVRGNYLDKDMFDGICQYRACAFQEKEEEQAGEESGEDTNEEENAEGSEPEEGGV